MERGGILHVSAVSTQPTAVGGRDTKNWLKLEKTRLLVSYAENEAQIINFKDSDETSKLVPVAALEGPTRAARLLTGSAAAATGQRVASSPCGKYIASAARGVVCLIEAETLKIVDAIKIKGVPKMIKSISFDSSSKQLLVGTTDRFVRIYNIVTSTANNDTIKNTEEKATLEAESKAIQQLESIESLVAKAGDHFINEGSFIHQQQNSINSITADENLLIEIVELKLSRLYDAQVEKLSWGACAFSPDGKHLVTSIDASSNEHVIYTWNVVHGYAENTLQAGSDGIIELTWHPEEMPMQCLAVGKSGKIYVWAKVMTQDWSAFAPDFETLTDNREHVEEETEFDVELAKEENIDGDGDEAAAEKKNEKKGVFERSKQSIEDEEIEIESWEWLGTSINENHQVWKSGWSAASTTGPLMHLPVIYPTEPVEEDEVVVEEEENEEQEIPEKQEEAEEAGEPMAVDGAEDGGGELQNALEEKNEGDDAEGATKKARIE